MIPVRKNSRQEGKKTLFERNGLDESMRRGWIFHPFTMVALLTVLALVLDFHLLGRPGIWFDEAFSVELARQPLPLLWHTIFGPEPNMELYYLLLHVWLQVTGWVGWQPVEWIVRFPSALCAALSTGVLFLLGRRYLGTLAAAVATVLYACNYLQLVYAQQARSYALQLLLLSVGWLALFLALQGAQPQKRWWIAYVVVMTLAIYAQLFSMLIVLSQVVAIIGLWIMPTHWRAQTRQRTPGFFISLIAIGVLSIPMFIESLHGSKTGWLPVPHLNDFQAFFTILSGDTPRYLVVMGGCMLAGLLCIVIVLWRQRVPAWYLRIAGGAEENVSITRHRDLWPFVWIMLCWFILPIVVSYGISQGSLRLFSTRYLVVVVPPFCFLTVLLLSIWRQWLVRAVLILGILGSAVLVVPHYYQNAQVETWNSAVHWLLDRYQAGDGLVCYDNATTQGCQIAVEYYLHAYPNGAYFSADSPGAFSWQKFSTNEAQNDPELALNPAIISSYASHHKRIFMIVGRVANDAGAVRVKQTQLWLDQQYHFIDQVVTPTVIIRLYQTQ
ncbi:glycosyltransferase family 39 protein [Dictyobacter arantiisoli]|nr:glycosyltransferase family 39 protein [Dictyobacter arantiisoli]